jgi:hypothetical protein
VLHILHNSADHHIDLYVPVADILFHNCCVHVLHGHHVFHHGPDTGLDTDCMVADIVVGEADTVEVVVGKQGELAGHMRVRVLDMLVVAFGRALVGLVVGLGEVVPGLRGRGFESGFVGFGW